MVNTQFFVKIVFDIGGVVGVWPTETQEGPIPDSSKNIFSVSSYWLWYVRTIVLSSFCYPRLTRKTKNDRHQTEFDACFF